MHPDDGNVSETLARIVDEVVVAKIWQLELRLYLLLAATFFVSLVLQLGPALSMLCVLYKMQLNQDRAQRWVQLVQRARRRVQSAGAEVLPEREPSSARRDSRRRRQQRRLQTGSVSVETHSDLRSPSRSESSSLPEHEPSQPSRLRRRHLQTRSAPEIPSLHLKCPQQMAGVVRPSRGSFETRSQPTLSSQASEPAAMGTRPRMAATEPALWAVLEGASDGEDGTDWGQQIAGNDGSGDGLNRDHQFGVSGQTSDVQLIQTIQRMREKLLVKNKDFEDGNDRAAEHGYFCTQR